ncbi:hypothetical protein FKM82_011265 [Ascaphus truei]
MKERIKEDNLPSCDEHYRKGTENIHLKRELGLFSAVSLIAGTMIGSGIFMSPEGVLRYMGSPGASLLIWAACGLLAMLGALSYAELGTVIKESGGEYIYILRNFGPLPAFLLAYTSVVVVRPASIAAISLSFAEYVVTPFYQGCPSPPLVVKCAAAACVLVLVVINCLNVRLATSIMNIFTTAKLLVLLVIIVGGVVRLIEGNTQVLQNAFENTATGFGPVGVAFYQGLWSYDGWNNLNYVTEELKNPEVNLPRAVMIAIPLVTCLYILVNVSYFAALTPSELLSSDAVAISWGLLALASNFVIGANAYQDCRVSPSPSQQSVYPIRNVPNSSSWKTTNCSVHASKSPGKLDMDNLSGRCTFNIWVSKWNLFYWRAFVLRGSKRGTYARCSINGPREASHTFPCSHIHFCRIINYDHTREFQ